MTFGNRVFNALRDRGPLCVGIDPHERLLSQWALAATGAGVREFGMRVIEAAAGRVGFVKAQVALFERYGSAGYEALEEVLGAGRAAGLIVIADAKRGDIGTTMDAYAHAWLTPGAPLEADALTVSPYLGIGALDTTFERARAHGKGVFVLAATSNPEGAGMQQALVQTGAVAGPTVARTVIDEVSARNSRHPSARLADVGFVIGATVDAAGYGLPGEVVPAAPILAPGFGAQGADPADLARRFGALAGQVIASESRSILSAGPEGLAAHIDVRAGLYRGNRHD